MSQPRICTICQEPLHGDPQEGYSLCDEHEAEYFAAQAKLDATTTEEA